MALRRVPREGGGPVARFALVLVQEDWIPAFAGNADLMVRFRDDTLWVWLPVMSGEIRGTP